MAQFEGWHLSNHKLATFDAVNNKFHLVTPATNDMQLVKRLSENDDRSAFTAIYNRYWDKLLAIAANKLDKDIALAEELVQDIFLDLWQRRTTLNIQSSLSHYLAAALKYKVIDARLKRKRFRVYQTTIAGKLPAVNKSTEEQVSFDELKRQLATHVNDLPRKCRLVYTLSKETGLSHKEISLHLSISQKSVEAHLTRALKFLRSRLTFF